MKWFKRYLPQSTSLRIKKKSKHNLNNRNKRHKLRVQSNKWPKSKQIPKSSKPKKHRQRSRNNINKKFSITLTIWSVRRYRAIHSFILKNKCRLKYLMWGTHLFLEFSLSGLNNLRRKFWQLRKKYSKGHIGSKGMRRL